MFSVKEDYWELFEIQEEDVEFLYNHLLEVETPLTAQELVRVLVEDRIEREKRGIEERRSAGGDIYFPENEYEIGQALVFPALGWRRGEVIDRRLGKNPDLESFEVIKVKFLEENGEPREFAMKLEEHRLNDPSVMVEDESLLNPVVVLDEYGDELVSRIEEGLDGNDEFVRIAGRWFPRALLIDVNVGHLNLAEAVLDIEEGGPIPTEHLLKQVELASDVNRKLAEFSLDYALWKDDRFDEVGPTGEVLWFLRRLEPDEVRKLPQFLEYTPIEYERSVLTDEMLELEKALDDELSPIDDSGEPTDNVEIRLIYPHWRAGSLPLSSRLRSLFPTAYQAPRIRFVLVDGDTGEKFPAWVVREKGYVYGLSDFYAEKGVIPGSLLNVRAGEKLGEVIVQADTHRGTREWIRTVLVGSDGGFVLAMLKQIITTSFDERMAIMVPELEALDDIWARTQNNRIPLERTVVDNLRELAKLNPQGHVHAVELYAAVNLIRRCPPGPLLALLASRPWFDHVGDLHFRFDDSERDYSV